jgi:hypothetical protein
MAQIATSSAPGQTGRHSSDSHSEPSLHFPDWAERKRMLER